MQIIAPVTDYIPASILTTLNDIVVRGAADPERQPGLIRAIGSRTSNFSTNVSGDVVLDNVGFNPSLLIFFSRDLTVGNMNFSWGFDNAALRRCVYHADNGTYQDVSLADSIFIRRDGSNAILGHVTARDALGFTVTFVLTGTCNVEVVYLALP